MNEENKQVYQEFKERRKKQIIVTVPALILILFIVLTADEQSQTVFGFSPQIVIPIFFACIVGLVIFSFRNWCCPSCGKYLGKTWNPKFCAKCGVRLRD